MTIRPLHALVTVAAGAAVMVGALTACTDQPDAPASPTLEPAAPGAAAPLDPQFEGAAAGDILDTYPGAFDDARFTVPLDGDKYLVLAPGMTIPDALSDQLDRHTERIAQGHPSDGLAFALEHEMAATITTLAFGADLVSLAEGTTLGQDGYTLNVYERGADGLNVSAATFADEPSAIAAANARANAGDPVIVVDATGRVDVKDAPRAQVVPER